MLLSALCGVLTLARFLLGGTYVRSMAADAAAAAAGTAYLYWYTPGLALQFAMVALGLGAARHGHRASPRWWCRC